MIKPLLSVLIIIFINGLFSYKYLIRLTDGAALAMVALSVLQLGAFYCARRAIAIPKLVSRLMGTALIMGIFGLLIYSHLRIPLESLAVDRWSVISSFWEEVFEGNYPYFAKSHLGNYPGPMPIYFLIALPFYYAGELGLLSVIGYLIFALRAGFRQTGRTPKDDLILILVGTSFFMIWEILTRSNVFTFSTFIVLLFAYHLKNQRQHILLAAVLFGLLLSTRSVYVLAYIVFFGSQLLLNTTPVARQVRVLLVAILAFVGSFVPLLLIWGDAFFEMNPFIIQSSFLIPTGYAIGFMGISAVLAFFVKKDGDVFFFSGMSLFLGIFIYGVYHVVQSGFEASYLQSQVDISYFILCIPFFLAYLNLPDLFDKSLSAAQSS